MSFSRKLFINWHTKKRQKSDISSSPDIVDTLSFMRYETVPFEVVIVEPDPAGTINSFKRVDITDLSMTMAVNDTLNDSTPLAAQSSWAKDTTNNTFSGNLDCNTGLMNTFIGSTASQNAYFEIEVLDSTGARSKIITEVCLVKLGVLTTTTTSPDPTKVYPTLDEALGLFLTRILGDQETITFKNGVYRRTLGVNADGSSQDDFYQI